MMYLNNLSDSMLRIIQDEHMSYETVAEKCDLSVRFIGKIIRKKAVPSLNSFEKICVAFDKTPNDLLGIETDDVTYRRPLKVTNVTFNSATCPRCDNAIDYAMQPYCSRCGQHLDWSLFDELAIAYSTK